MKKLMAVLFALLLTTGAAFASEKIEADRVLVIGLDNCGDYKIAFIMDGKTGRMNTVPLAQLLEQNRISEEQIERRIKSFEGQVVEVKSEKGKCTTL